MTAERSEYDVGHAAGAIDARLAQHDRHFEAINGSIRDVASEMSAMKLLLQRLADSADSDRRTVVTTASALKDAEEARRSTTTDRWSPWQKGAVIIGAIGTVVGILAWALTSR
jgi:hypothetical protein